MWLRFAFAIGGPRIARASARLFAWMLPGLLVGCAASGSPGDHDEGPPRPALRVAVMDPLADRLACACVRGHAQRRYDRLAAFLARRF